jgi:hypothetical protein
VRIVPSFDPGAITRPTIIAMHRSRCRHAARSSSFASSSRRAIVSAALTCPAGSDRSISNASSTLINVSPAKTRRSASIASAGR